MYALPYASLTYSSYSINIFLTIKV